MNQNQQDRPNQSDQKQRAHREARTLLRLAAFGLLVTSLFYGVQIWQDRYALPPPPHSTHVRIKAKSRATAQRTDTYNLPAVTEASKRCPECSGDGGE